MKKLEINYDSQCPDWWDAVNNLDPSARPDIMNEFLFLEDFVCIEDEEAEEFLQWAAMFPGWEGEPIVVVDLDEKDEKPIVVVDFDE